ncbi:AAA-ATPase-like domain-containing protein [Mycena indigotica]|uniref:AAA-ATPase-like domain-containing protein n=1 Tax=Mycena indigotica TaxID=2126181 RepID=A0A8H6TES3_9AGAR|nr:AAA-ATPase-like domain-containing protein [Mycena indigotica]KAF7316388.1 AAA-ATPase-like domain-containing protein [Mycena indigotica]
MPLPSSVSPTFSDFSDVLAGRGKADDDLSHPHLRTSTSRSRAQKRTLSESGSETDTDDSLPGSKRLNARATSPSFSLSPDTSFEISSELNLPAMDDLFTQLIRKPEAYVDKTGCIAQLPAKYTAVMIRPPRFGKSTFISTLAQYYDARDVVSKFTWEGLDVYAQGSFASRDRHLCLMFCFPDSIIENDLSGVEWDIKAHVTSQLYAFVRDYSTELGLSEVPEVISTEMMRGQPDLLAIFAEFWDVVKQSGRTLFVGVDDYDAALRSYELFPFEGEGNEDRPQLRDAIEELMDRWFWEPLLHGIDFVPKLLVAGMLSLDAWNSQISKSLSSLPLVEMPELCNSCGFNEDEARDFSATFLPSPPPFTDFEHTAGQYYFPPHSESVPLLHPQQLILRVARLTGHEISPLLTTSFPRLSGILASLDADADDERVTQNTLVDLLAQGTIEAAHYQPLCGRAIGVGLLRDLGLLSYDSEGQLRVASQDILQEIHLAAYSVANASFSLPSKLHPALWLGDGFAPLLALSTKVLANRTIRGLSRELCPEPTMHGVLELLFRGPISPWRYIYDPLIMVPPLTTAAH